MRMCFWISSWNGRNQVLQEVLEAIFNINLIYVNVFVLPSRQKTTWPLSVIFEGQLWPFQQVMVGRIQVSSCCCWNWLQLVGTTLRLHLRLLNAAGGGAHAGSADGISLAQALEPWHRRFYNKTDCVYSICQSTPNLRQLLDRLRIDCPDSRPFSRFHFTGRSVIIVCQFCQFISNCLRIWNARALKVFQGLWQQTWA